LQRCRPEGRGRGFRRSIESIHFSRYGTGTGGSNGNVVKIRYVDEVVTMI